MSEHTSVLKKENRIRLDPLVHESLRYYVSEEREALKVTPGAKIDENTVVSDLTRQFLAERGHYPPRTSNIVEDSVKTVETRRAEIRSELVDDIKEAERSG